jgi:hypothetical protein
MRNDRHIQNKKKHMKARTVKNPIQPNGFLGPEYEDSGFRNRARCAEMYA